MRIEIKLTGADSTLRMLRALPREISGKRVAPARQALRKGAVVIRDAARANLRVQTSNATSEGRQLSTGLLERNIIVSVGRLPPGQRGELYRVRVRRRVFYVRKQRVSISKTGALLEYGSSQQPAEPWLRPAVNSHAQQAIETVVRELNAGIQRLVQRLRASGGR